MGGSKTIIRPRQPVHAAEADLVETRDDFSIKVASRLDRRFWVRVERAIEDGTVVVTDFVAGDRPYGELEAAILLAVRDLDLATIKALVFRDLVPSGDQSEGFPVKVVQSADRVKQLGVAVEREFGLAGAVLELQPRRGKIDARVTFRPA